MPVVYLDLQDAGRDVAHLRWGLPIIGVLFALAAEVALVAIRSFVTSFGQARHRLPRRGRSAGSTSSSARRIAATPIAVVLSLLLAPGEEAPPARSCSS